MRRNRHAGPAVTYTESANTVAADAWKCRESEYLMSIESLINNRAEAEFLLTVHDGTSAAVRLEVSR